MAAPCRHAPRSSPSPRRRRTSRAVALAALAAAALAAAVLAPAAGAAPTTISTEARATPIAAWAGTVVWSTFDATTNDYHLVVSRNGAAPQRLPVAPERQRLRRRPRHEPQRVDVRRVLALHHARDAEHPADRLRPLPPEHRVRRRDEARHALLPHLGRARADDLPRRDRVHPQRDARRPERGRPAHRQHHLRVEGHDRPRRAQPPRRLAPGPRALREPPRLHPVQPQRHGPRRPCAHAEGGRERQAGLPCEVRRRELREHHRSVAERHGRLVHVGPHEQRLRDRQPDRPIHDQLGQARLRDRLAPVPVHGVGEPGVRHRRRRRPVRRPATARRT